VAKQTTGKVQANRSVPIAVGAAGGAGLGFAFGRMAAPSGATVAAKLAEGLLSQAAMSSAASII
jgi:hypothetical protein